MITGRFFYGVQSEPMLDKQTFKTFVEIILPGAFRDSIDGGADIAMLVEHFPSVEIASVAKRTLRLTDSDVGLHFEADVSSDLYGLDAMRCVQDGKAHISPTFRYIEKETEPGPNGIELRRVIRATLHDLSVLTTSRPAYRQAPLQWSYGRQPALEVRRIEPSGYVRGALGAGYSRWRE
jgi:HK97 family phage prohead protease